MRSGTNIAAIAGLIGEPGRAAMLGALAGGDALRAGELAAAAGLSAQAASGHLAKLVAGRLLAVERKGRLRFYRLAGAEVATVLEQLAVLAGPPPPTASASRTTVIAGLRTARTCYDHLAGALGVELAVALERHGVVAGIGDSRAGITDAGADWLARRLAIDVATLRPTGRGLVRGCLDWTHRRHHLAGPLGAALLRRFVALGWVERLPGSRAIQVTAAGRAGFRESLGIAA
ncbi:MAG: helix-turn-helix transcriptional regulator [Rhodospirillales bacterium]|nr:helix-turn-helix transcriptional regulator [Rhodospirillales bacterium]